MPIITIQSKEYSYDENEIIDFTEGLIGLPEMRRAVLVSVKDYEPFCWLASIDDEKNRFIVVNPHEIFADYEPIVSKDLDGMKTKMMTIVKVSSDWQKTTVNLRAPIFINPETRRGGQFVLTESNYSLAEKLPQT